MNYEIVKKISELTNLSEEQVINVLYIYSAEVLHKCITDPMQQTSCLFGTLYVDDNDKLQLESGNQVKDGSLVSRSDLWALIKLMKGGPGKHVFS